MLSPYWTALPSKDSEGSEEAINGVSTGLQALCDAWRRWPGVMAVGLTFFFERCQTQPCVSNRRSHGPKVGGQLHLSWKYHFVHVLQLEIDTNVTNKPKSRLPDRLGGIDLRQNFWDTVLDIKKQGSLRSANWRRNITHKDPVHIREAKRSPEGIKVMRTH